MTVSTKIGFGPKVSGEIVVMGEPGKLAASHQISSELHGKIILFLSYAPIEHLEKAGLVGVKGVVVPSIHFRDFVYLRQQDEFSLLVLTKFGKVDISKELADKLVKMEGKKGSLDGEEKKLEA